MRSLLQQCLLLLVYVCSCLSCIAHAEGHFFVYDGHSLVAHPNEDPESFAAKEWQIRLYRKGQATGGADYWGLITGKSVGSVQRQLKAGQAFETMYQRWCHCGDEVLTSFNPLGPIAVVDPPEANTKPPLANVIERVNQLAEKMDDYTDALNQINTLYEKEAETDPFKKRWGKVFEEYTGALKNAFQKLVQARQRLADPLANISSIETIINAMTADLAHASVAHQQIAQGLHLPNSDWREQHTVDVRDHGNLHTTVETTQHVTIENGQLKVTSQTQQQDRFIHPVPPDPPCQPGRPCQVILHSEEEGSKVDTFDAAVALQDIDPATIAVKKEARGDQKVWWVTLKAKKDAVTRHQVKQENGYELLNSNTSASSLGLRFVSPAAAEQMLQALEALLPAAVSPTVPPVTAPAAEQKE